MYRLKASLARLCIASRGANVPLVGRLFIRQLVRLGVSQSSAERDFEIDCARRGVYQIQNAHAALGENTTMSGIPLVRVSDVLSGSMNF